MTERASVWAGRLRHTCSARLGQGRLTADVAGVDVRYYSRRSGSRRVLRRDRRWRNLIDDDKATDTAGGAKEGVPANEAAIGVLPGLAASWGRLGSCGYDEQGSGSGQTRAFEGVGEEAVVAHPDKASGDDVKQEAASELGSGEGPWLLAAAVLSILEGESNLPIAVLDEAFVGHGDAVGVATEVAQDLLGSCHRGLGVDDEVLGSGLAKPISRGRLRGAFGERILEGFEQLAPEDLGELADRKEEVRPG